MKYLGMDIVLRMGKQKWHHWKKWRCGECGSLSNLDPITSHPSHLILISYKTNTSNLPPSRKESGYFVFTTFFGYGYKVSALSLQYSNIRSYLFSNKQ
jgi:hypothetical protein